MINELRHIFNEPELATPRDRDGSQNSLSGLNPLDQAFRFLYFWSSFFT